MQPQNLSFSKTINPSFLLCPSPKPCLFASFPHQNRPFSCQYTPILSVHHRDIRAFAGRSKKKPGDQSSGRLEGNSEIRRVARQNARRKQKKRAESLFYRLKNPGKSIHADNFTEEELEAIGLGYDRMVRFMEKDDPNLKHPFDWYKYGEFGPYSWRGVVVGEPIRGRFSDERVTMIGEVKNHEEWEKIEQFEMASEFGKRLEMMDRNVGFRYFWVFVRHPKWRISELPWEQWTLVSEVVLEAKKTERLDKWSLMGRLGNKARSLITQCAAWMRPDIIYVKKPVYQCRFEGQDEFFNALIPFLDPKTERDFLFEVKKEDRSVEMCSYFEGLCKIVKVNQKAFVDDVVKGFEKLSEEGKSRCLGFLLGNHPLPLLHPYTKEWKAKLEEMELGCDAPDDDEDVGRHRESGEMQFTDWIEDDYGGRDDDDDDDDEAEDQDDVVLDIEDKGDEELGTKEEESDEEEDEKYWEEEFQKALSSSDRMEKLVKRSVEVTTELYNKQLAMLADRKERIMEDGDETELRGKRAKVKPEEWKRAGIGRWNKRIKKSKIPPELFLRAAVRPFTYRNLVKEIVLTRHAILEGEIGRKD
ncbi:uncharacterized protein LOC105769438 [Gossypium raimondii]|uniref:Uncharacterized protein n=1 Tax=Gossypium raimondii TaxID=29730 RepID=A0A0D2Q4U2_GOSRA|nr:uncharacterized protein LOC105769438 [Gossypium raimondii]KJB11636.1 hypothetical protein B456_001G269000 [Gossypium raimondii]